MSRYNGRDRYKEVTAMSLRTNYRHTMFACYLGYITQATVNIFAPLLFLTFQNQYHISLEKITFLVTLNFGIQLLVDLLSAKFVDRVGIRTSILAAHLLAALGLAGLGILPELMTPYTGLLLSVCCYAIGGGLIEVLVSPIAEACPTERKEASMSLLHSFYCWGCMLVIIGSTVFFTLVGMDHWRTLACLWAIIPLLNFVYFTQVPIAPLVEEGRAMPISTLLRSRLFWLLALLMVCAGASELSMSQWASAFAESGLGVSKSLGDLAGPCFFALLMGVSRVIYANISHRVELTRFMAWCSILCAVSYLLAVFAPWPILSLMGCGLCGLSVGIMWPGTFSLAARGLPTGGTALFALLALAGDLGCTSGPTIVGLVSGLQGGELRAGLLAATIFPLILLVLLFRFRQAVAKKQA